MTQDSRAKFSGHTFVVTEKPETAKRIAFALDLERNPKKMYENGVPYYVAQRNEEILVVPARGHLYTVAAEKNTRTYCPVLNFKWLPRFLVEKKAKQTHRWLETFTSLARNASRFVDACDYDIEGSIIGYNILKYACDQKEKIAKRMKYSVLTEEELEKAYSNPLPHLDFALIEAGLARHEIDWLYGINLSRALTTAIKIYSGKHVTLSIGRVQGPTLKFLATRERTMKRFIPTPYWQLKATIQIGGRNLEAEYDKARISSESEAQKIKESCEGKNGKIQKIEKKLFQRDPPVPFDLGALQTEAYRFFKYTPRKTSEIAERLYLDALISYPRTSSQRLPPGIDYRTLLENLGKAAEYRQLTSHLLTKSNLEPHEGKRWDSAHPAMYPTGSLPSQKSSASEANVWDLIVKRFMAVFAEPSANQTTKVTIDIHGYCFIITSEKTVKEGWMSFYKPHVTPKHGSLPPMTEGQVINVKKIEIEAKVTEPPLRYDQRSILQRMEHADIGTKGTRAEIIQTLYDRKYVKGEKMMLTDLGLELVEVLEKECPSIVDPELTREIQRQMNDIRISGEKREKIVAETAHRIGNIVRELINKENEIGKSLTQAVTRTTAEEMTIGACPTCKKGNLFITHSKSTGKRFIGCTNYFKGICKTSYPLPQKGTISRRAKTCKRCGWPTLNVKLRGKHTWTLCFNPECPRKERRTDTAS